MILFFLSTQEFFSCCWTKWQKNIVSKNKSGKFYDKFHRHRAIRAMPPRRKPSPQCAVLLAHIWQFSQTESRQLTRRHIHRCCRGHAALVPTRYNVRIDTNDSVREDSWIEVQEDLWPLGEQVLVCRPRPSFNQLLRPWDTSLSLGRDTLSDEHLKRTAAGVTRSRAVRHLQDPARWVPDASNAMLFAPSSPHLNLPGPRLQRPACQEPVEAGALTRFTRVQQPQPHGTRSQISS